MPFTDEQKAAYRRGRLLHLLADLWEQYPDRSFWDLLQMVNAPYGIFSRPPTDHQFCDRVMALIRETPRGRERDAALAELTRTSEEMGGYGEGEQ